MELPNWKQDMPKLPDLKRFQRTFQGFQGMGQGAWGKFSKWNSDLWRKNGKV